MIRGDYYDRLSKVESGDNPSAQNPASSAKGRFQFIDSTAQQYGITAEFGTPEYEAQEQDAVRRFTADNFNVLKTTLKREPTPGELYLAHQQGAGGASKLLASPNARAVDVLGKDAVLKNGGKEDMTAREFASKWIEKFESGVEKTGSSGNETLAGGQGNDALFTKEQILQELERRKSKGVNTEVPVSPTAAPQFTREQITAELQRRNKEKGTPTYIQRIYKLAQDREAKIQDTLTLSREAQTPVAGIIPQAGEAAAFVGDVAFETVATAARAVAPQTTEFIGDVAGSVVSYVMDTPPARLLSGEYKNFKTQHPLLAENIEGALGTALFVAPITGASKVSATGKVIDKATDTVETAVKSSDDLLKKLSAPAVERAKEARAAMRMVQTDRAVQRILKASSKSYDDMLNELKNSDVLTIADIAGDEVQGMTRSLGKFEGAKDIIHLTLRQRSEAAVSRVTAVLSEKISNVENYFGNIDELGKARSVAAKPLYKKAFAEADNIVDGRLVKFLEDKRIIDAMEDAKLRYGVRLEAGANSLETLDGVKKVLYDIEAKAKRAGETNLAGVYGDLRRSLVEVLDDASPTYKQARKVFEHPSKLIDAQEMGRNFSKMQPEELRAALSDMAPHELEAYRIGVRQKLQEIVSTTADGADPAKRIFGNEMKRKQLEAVFETKEHYDEFAKRMRDEISGFETRNAILGGSRTDYNIVGDIGFIDAAADASRRGFTTTVIEKTVDAVWGSVKRAYTGISKENAKEIAEILVDRKKGIDALQKLLEKQTDFQQRAAVAQVIKNHGAVVMNSD